MIGGLNNLLATSFYPKSGSGTKVNPIAPLFNYKTAQMQNRSLASSFLANNAQVKKLKDDSVRFLNKYTSDMKRMDSAAGKLTNGNINKILYDKSGVVTDETVKATVTAVQNMAEQYNAVLTNLNANADRGQGVKDQIYRMADNPATKNVMDMVGITVNKDATLSVNAEKLTAALKTTNPDQLKLYKDAIGGNMGVAAGVQRDARAGLQISAGRLIGADIAVMNSIKAEDPLRSMAAYTKQGAYALNNLAAAGMMMNLLV